MKSRKSHVPRTAAGSLGGLTVMQRVGVHDAGSSSARHNRLFADGIIGKYGFWRQDYFGRLALIFRELAGADDEELEDGSAKWQKMVEQLQAQLAALKHADARHVVTRTETVHRLERLIHYYGGMTTGQERKQPPQARLEQGAAGMGKGSNLAGLEVGQSRQSASDAANATQKQPPQAEEQKQNPRSDSRRGKKRKQGKKQGQAEKQEQMRTSGRDQDPDFDPALGQSQDLLTGDGSAEIRVDASAQGKLQGTEPDQLTERNAKSQQILPLGIQLKPSTRQGIIRWVSDDSNPFELLTMQSLWRGRQKKPVNSQRSAAALPQLAGAYSEPLIKNATQRRIQTDRAALTPKVSGYLIQSSLTHRKTSPALTPVVWHTGKLGTREWNSAHSNGQILQTQQAERDHPSSTDSGIPSVYLNTNRDRAHMAALVQRQHAYMLPPGVRKAAQTDFSMKLQAKRGPQWMGPTSDIPGERSIWARSEEASTHALVKKVMRQSGFEDGYINREHNAGTRGGDRSLRQQERLRSRSSITQPQISSARLEHTANLIHHISAIYKARHEQPEIRSRGLNGSSTTEASPRTSSRDYPELEANAANTGQTAVRTAQTYRELWVQRREWTSGQPSEQPLRERDEPNRLNAKAAAQQLPSERALQGIGRVGRSSNDGVGLFIPPLSLMLLQTWQPSNARSQSERNEGPPVSQSQLRLRTQQRAERDEQTLPASRRLPWRVEVDRQARSSSGKAEAELVSNDEKDNSYRSPSSTLPRKVDAARGRTAAAMRKLPLGQQAMERAGFAAERILQLTKPLLLSEGISIHPPVHLRHGEYKQTAINGGVSLQRSNETAIRGGITPSVVTPSDLRYMPANLSNPPESSAKLTNRIIDQDKAMPSPQQLVFQEREAISPDGLRIRKRSDRGNANQPQMVTGESTGPQRRSQIDQAAANLFLSDEGMDLDAGQTVSRIERASAALRHEKIGHPNNSRGFSENRSLTGAMFPVTDKQSGPQAPLHKGSEAYVEKSRPLILAAATQRIALDETSAIRMMPAAQRANNLTDQDTAGGRGSYSNLSTSMRTNKASELLGPLLTANRTWTASDQSDDQPTEKAASLSNAAKLWIKPWVPLLGASADLTNVESAIRQAVKPGLVTQAKGLAWLEPTRRPAASLHAAMPLNRLQIDRAAGTEAGRSKLGVSINRRVEAGNRKEAAVRRSVAEDGVRLPIRSSLQRRTANPAASDTPASETSSFAGTTGLRMIKPDKPTDKDMPAGLAAKANAPSEAPTAAWGSSRTPALQRKPEHPLLHQITYHDIASIQWMKPSIFSGSPDLQARSIEHTQLRGSKLYESFRGNVFSDAAGVINRRASGERDKSMNRAIKTETPAERAATHTAQVSKQAGSLSNPYLQRLPLIGALSNGNIGRTAGSTPAPASLTAAAGVIRRSAAAAESAERDEPVSRALKTETLAERAGNHTAQVIKQAGSLSNLLLKRLPLIGALSDRSIGRASASGSSENSGSSGSHGAANTGFMSTGSTITSPIRTSFTNAGSTTASASLTAAAGVIRRAASTAESAERDEPVSRALKTETPAERAASHTAQVIKQAGSLSNSVLQRLPLIGAWSGGKIGRASGSGSSENSGSSGSHGAANTGFMSTGSIITRPIGNSFTNAGSTTASASLTAAAGVIRRAASAAESAERDVPVSRSLKTEVPAERAASHTAQVIKQAGSLSNSVLQRLPLIGAWSGGKIGRTPGSINTSRTRADSISTLPTTVPASLRTSAASGPGITSAAMAGQLDKPASRRSVNTETAVERAANHTAPVLQQADSLSNSVLQRLPLAGPTVTAFRKPDESHASASLPSAAKANLAGSLQWREGERSDESIAARVQQRAQHGIEARRVGTIDSTAMESSSGWPQGSSPLTGQRSMASRWNSSTVETGQVAAIQLNRGTAANQSGSQTGQQRTAANATSASRSAVYAAQLFNEDRGRNIQLTVKPMTQAHAIPQAIHTISAQMASGGGLPMFASGGLQRQAADPFQRRQQHPTQAPAAAGFSGQAAVGANQSNSGLAKSRKRTAAADIFAYSQHPNVLPKLSTAQLEHKQQDTKMQASDPLSPPSLELLRPQRQAEPEETLVSTQTIEPSELTREQINELIKQLPQLDVNQIVDKVTRELERRMRFERQRRGK
jgi:hypothetical protein